MTEWAEELIVGTDSACCISLSLDRELLLWSWGLHLV